MQTLQHLFYTLQTHTEFVRLAKGIVKANEFLNSIRVECTGDLCRCARRLEAVVRRRKLDEKLEDLLAEFVLEACVVASEELCGTDLIAYGEWQYLHDDRPIARVVITVQHDGEAICFWADVVEVYDGEVKREVCRVAPDLPVCAKEAK